MTDFIPLTHRLSNQQFQKIATAKITCDSHTIEL